MAVDVVRVAVVDDRQAAGWWLRSRARRDLRDLLASRERERVDDESTPWRIDSLLRVALDVRLERSSLVVRLERSSSVNCVL